METRGDGQSQNNYQYWNGIDLGRIKKNLKCKKSFDNQNFFCV